jgi:hypothetical protein
MITYQIRLPKKQDAEALVKFMHEEYFPAVHKGPTRVGKVTHLVLLQAEPEGVCIPLFSCAITPKSLCTRKRLRKIFRNPMITFASLSCLSELKSNYETETKKKEITAVNFPNQKK